MNAPDKPPRRWLQFHLVTALILMLIAGVWVGLNVRSETDFTGGPVLLPGVEGEGKATREPLRLVRRSFGLPYPFLIVLYHVPDSASASGRSPVGIYPSQGARFEPGAFALDLLALAGLLVFAGAASEWILRRRRV